MTTGLFDSSVLHHVTGFVMAQVSLHLILVLFPYLPLLKILSFPIFYVSPL